MIQVKSNEIVVSIGNTSFTMHLENDKAIITKQEGHIKCPLCGGEWQPHQFGAVHSPMKGNAVDINFKCTTCHWFNQFGIPIPSSDVEALQQYAVKWIYSEDAIIKKRLNDLGYW